MVMSDIVNKKEENNKINDFERKINSFKRCSKSAVKISETNIYRKDQQEAKRYFFQELKNTLEISDGFIDKNGIPFSIAALMWCELSDYGEEDLYKNRRLFNLDQIIELFNLITSETDLDELINKAESRLHSFHDFIEDEDEWSFKCENKENNELVLKFLNLYDDNKYVITNIFSSHKYRGIRYFRYSLECVVGNNKTNSKLGEIKCFEASYRPLKIKID